jgi:hypothetical protein
MKDAAMQRAAKAEAKSRVLTILSRHVGIEKAVGMGELYERVYGENWQNRINDTRRLRSLITELRYDGTLIGETRTRQGGGYYLARSSHELGQFFGRRKREALKKLNMIAAMQRIGLDELLGQMRLNLGALSHAENAEGAEKI